uniref:CARD domain-containing protein n=1 Tax=Labrus bergylta TaxID=56723 RepID=A0A3Q3MHB0_9LABR
MTTTFHHSRLFAIRCSFIEGVSAPVLKSLLDKLFEETVMNDSERESADEMQNKRDKARSVIDTVRKKGDAASSKMIKALCDLDHFLCEHLGLICS